MVDFGAAGAGGARLDEMQISEAKRVELLDRVGVERHRVRLAAAIGDAIGRQPHPDAIRAPDLDHGFRYFHQEAHAVRNRAAILIGAQIGARLQKLLDQIAVGTMDLDAVESGRRARSSPLADRRRSRLIFRRYRAPAASRRRQPCRRPCRSSNRRSAPPMARPAARRPAGTRSARRARHARAAGRSRRPWHERHRPPRASPRSAARYRCRARRGCRSRFP